MQRLGAFEIVRDEFLQRLRRAVELPVSFQENLSFDPKSLVSDETH
jgi:hypothetical protein